MSEPTIYAITLTFDTLYIEADLTQAAAQVNYWTGEDPPGVDEDGEWRPTGFQTADTGHRERRAAVLAVMAMGRSYWLDPSDEDEITPEHEATYIDRLIVSIEVWGGLE